MDISEVLESLNKGKISVNKAKKLLELYSIEEVENFAKIDINRKMRKGIPEVIFAEKKQLLEIKKIIASVLKKSDSVLVSRIQKKDYSKVINFSKKISLLPNAFFARFFVFSIADFSSLKLLTICMPIPPPPALALIKIG